MVQGVGFRYFATSTAQDFPITGYVRNLDTGDVEIEIEGAKDDVSGFLMAIKKGPKWANVATFQIEWKKYKNSYDKFSVRYK